MNTTGAVKLPPPDTSVRKADVPGEVGVWVVIFGDMLVFAMFFATFLYYRGRDPHLFATSQRALNTDLGALYTLLLLTGSLLVVTGVRAIRAGAQRLAPPMFAGAFLCGAVFVCAKCLEYADKFADGITAATNNFYMLYFIFTWLHLFHVLVGMGLLIFMFMQARKPTLTVQQFSYVEGGSCFWHMVDLLWVVLFPLIYLVRS